LLAEIIKSLTQQNKTQKDSNERARRESENTKRAFAESKLEKGFALAIKTAEKVVAPVKSMLRRIIDFFMAIFWGKVFFKLLDWFADPANKKKIDSLFRFFGDHWPKLLALYLRFGTGLGKFVGSLTNLVFLGTRKLLQVIAGMVGAKGAARFLGGRGGKLVQAGLQVGATVGTTMALSGGIEKFVGSEEKEPKIPTYKGGGFANFRKLFGMFGEDLVLDM
jgi:TM2 domain-containing membrane protein YozV